MKKYITSIGLSLLPVVALAADVSVTGGISDVGAQIKVLFNFIIPILLTIAVFVIIFGIFRFILNAGDEEARKSGRSFILWGIVGIFLMLSVWGLVNILYSTIHLNSTPITPPGI